MSVRRAIAALTLLVAGACKGPPAHLVAGTADTVVVRSAQPSQIPVRVYDARGDTLPTEAVRFQWSSGRPVELSPTGMATCTGPGEATVRASLAGVATTFVLLCRPVSELKSPWFIEMVLGDPAQRLPVQALGADGKPVAILSGSVTIADSSIATVRDLSIRPRAAGNTSVEVRVGDRLTTFGVAVYERVSTLEGLRPDQRHVVVPLRLASGEERRWRIPAGTFIVSIAPEREGAPKPTLAIVGANCLPEAMVQGYVCIAKRQASVIAYHPWSAKAVPALSGQLALWRLPES